MGSFAKRFVLVFVLVCALGAVTAASAMATAVPPSPVGPGDGSTTERTPEFDALFNGDTADATGSVEFRVCTVATCDAAGDPVAYGSSDMLADGETGAW